MFPEASSGVYPVISKVSSPKSVGIEVAARQLTIIRENTSKTNAT